MSASLLFVLFFFFNDTATTEIYTLSLHDALPICPSAGRGALALVALVDREVHVVAERHVEEEGEDADADRDGRVLAEEEDHADDEEQRGDARTVHRTAPRRRRVAALLDAAAALLGLRDGAAAAALGVGGLAAGAPARLDHAGGVAAVLRLPAVSRLGHRCSGA